MATQKLEQSQELKQVQTLNLQQIALGRFLSMSSPELKEAVARAVDDNPALAYDLSEDAPDNMNGDYALAEDSSENILSSTSSGDDNDDDSFGHPGASLSSKKAEFFDTLSTLPGETLEENLVAQLAAINLNPRSREIVEYVIKSLDSDGYLRRSAASLADDLTLAAGEEFYEDELQTAVNLVRSLEPKGVAAADLRDCLLLQLKASPIQDDLNALAIRTVDKYFEELANRNFDKLLQRLDIDRERLRDVLARIRSLNPRPGAGFEQSQTYDRLSHISADFYVAPLDSSGERFNISLLNSSPALRIDENFNTLIPSSESSKSKEEANVFIRRKTDEANRLIRLLEARSHTLMEIVRAIVRRQKDFFISNNPVDIKPMVLKDIAADTGFSQSLISRAASEKYVDTPSGLFPLKLLFNEKPREGDDSLTREAIGEAIREAVGNESPSSPLTDNQLVEILRSRGLDIARRTVTKHRERLKIPVARLRKSI